MVIVTHAHECRGLPGAPLRVISAQGSKDSFVGTPVPARTREASPTLAGPHTYVSHTRGTHGSPGTGRSADLDHPAHVSGPMGGRGTPRGRGQRWGTGGRFTTALFFGATPATPSLSVALAVLPSLRSQRGPERRVQTDNGRRCR